MKKKILSVLLVSTIAASLLAGCGKTEDDKVITVGASPTPHAEILQVIEDNLAEQGYTLKIVEYNDILFPTLQRKAENWMQIISSISHT